jgi:hypothetical protein
LFAVAERWSPPFAALHASYPAEATMHSMPMFGFFDVILAGIVGLVVLIAVVMTLPDLIRTMKIHAM